MGTYCAPLVADCFILFCYERDIMLSISDVSQGGSIKDFYSILRDLDKLLNINTIYFERMINQIFPATSV